MDKLVISVNILVGIVLLLKCITSEGYNNNYPKYDCDISSICINVCQCSNGAKFFKINRKPNGVIKRRKIELINVRCDNLITNKQPKFFPMPD